MGKDLVEGEDEFRVEPGDSESLGGHLGGGIQEAPDRWV